MFSLFYLLVKTTKRDFGSIKHAEIKQVLSFKQVSVTLSNFLNRKNKKTGKKQVSEPPPLYKIPQPSLSHCKTNSKLNL